MLCKTRRATRHTGSGCVGHVTVTPGNNVNIAFVVIVNNAFFNQLSATIYQLAAFLIMPSEYVVSVVR